MAVKYDERSSYAVRTAHPAHRQTPMVRAKRGGEPSPQGESDQLSQQVGRVLEQLITLDEQYHDAIMKHDPSALEALSACTVALSKLSHARLAGSTVASASGMNDKPSLQDRRSQK